MSGPPLSRLRANGLAGCALILACILALQLLPLLQQRWATRHITTERSAALATQGCA